MQQTVYKLVVCGFLAKGVILFGAVRFGCARDDYAIFSPQAPSRSLQMVAHYVMVFGAVVSLIFASIACVLVRCAAGPGCERVCVKLMSVRLNMLILQTVYAKLFIACLHSAHLL